MGGKSNKKKRKDAPSKVLPCRYCDMTFYNKTHLDKHIHRSHLNTESHYCPECPEVKDNIHDFLYHMRSEHKIGHLCRVCKQSFPRQKIRAVHEKEVHSYIHGQTPKPAESQPPTAFAQPTSSQSAQIPQVAAPTQINPAMQMVTPVIPPVAVPPMYNPYMPSVIANINPQMPINPMFPQTVLAEPLMPALVQQPLMPTLVQPPRQTAYATTQQNKNPALKAFEVAQKITAQIANVQQHQPDYYSSRPQPKPSMPPGFSPPSFAPPVVLSSRNEEYKRPSRFSSDDRRENDYEGRKETYKRRHEGNDDYDQERILMDYVKHRSEEDDYRRHESRRDYRDEPEKSYSYNHASRSYATDYHRDGPPSYTDREHYSYAQAPSKSNYQQGSSRHNPY